MSALMLPAALSLAQACSPQVAPATLLSVAQAESGLDPLAIGINDRPRRALHPATLAAAIEEARRLVAAGRNVDLGLLQINSRNLGPLGLRIDDAFDPCRSLHAGGRVLTAAYVGARTVAASTQTALNVALSRYNTGGPTRGVTNGYVAHVRQAAARLAPALAVGLDAAPTQAALERASAWVELRAVRAPQPVSAAVNVFARPSPVLVDWARPLAWAPSNEAGPPSGSEPRSHPQGDPS